MRKFVATTKALACDKRLRILMALRERELCEGVIAELLGLAPATTSRHLWLLEQAGLVDSEKSGRCVCYRRAVVGPSTQAGKALRWVEESLAGHPQIAQDTAKAQALSTRSSVQAECRERKQRIPMRAFGSANRAPRKFGVTSPVR